MLALCYTWALKGKPLKVRSRWPSQGRINLIGAWLIYGKSATLYYREVKGKCNAVQVQAFIESLAAQRKDEQLMVIVLDNAPFHKGDVIKSLIPSWQQINVFLRFLPSYCPNLNYIECLWKKLKGFLMPRRYYNSLAELRAALLVALNALGAVSL